MFDLQHELFNLNYREVIVSPKDFFPKLNLERVKARFLHLRKADPHQTIYAVCRALSEGGYSLLMDEQGFWHPDYQKYSNHSHQCCSILALVLYSLGFEVSYLEGFRIRDYVLRTGIIEQVPPSEEENPKNKPEFEKIKRIPYSCVEVIVRGLPYYISPKHAQIDLGTNSLQALLKPECYSEFIGTFRHQNDGTKSGIYLKAIKPENNLQKHNFTKRIVWMKQTFKDDFPEFFATFSRMKLE